MNETIAAALSFRKNIKTKDVDLYRKLALTLRKKMISEDVNYPRYHFTAPEGWMNDPNGLIFYNGLYHLFFQYRPILFENSSADGSSFTMPNKIAWGHATSTDPFHWKDMPVAMCWGHATSTDLFHWKDMPVAMWPDAPFDIKGVCSGNSILSPDGTPCALYTGNANGHQETYGVLAVAQDERLCEWKKQVVMSEPPYEGTKTHWDAQLWKKDGIYYQLCGARKNGAGAANLYTSTDLKKWDFASTIYSQDIDSFWELPYLIESNGKFALFVGAQKTNPYWIGTFDYQTLTFIPDSPEPLNADTGTYYSYNPSMIDADGRRLMFGWITGPESPCNAVPYWQGVQSIPREIEILNGVLSQRPATELDSLKYFSMELGNVQLTSTPFVIKDTTNAYELRFTLESVTSSDTVITFKSDDVSDPTIARLIISPDGTVTFEGNTTVSTKQMFDASSGASFRIFADGSVFEIYAQSGTNKYDQISRAMTARAFSSDGYPLAQIEITGSGELSLLGIDKIKCIWED